MAIGTNLPPQAYTRETLTQAFAWLQTQPEAIRRSATTPESLVSLYTRNQRFGPDYNKTEVRFASTAPISPLAGDDDLDNLSSPTEAPISAQNFKTDLKTLAEGLKQFDDPRGSRTTTHQVNNYGQQANQHHGSQPSSQHVGHQATQTPPQPVQQQLRAPPASFSSQSTASAGIQGLSQASQQMIQEVKHSLNLSSDLEAINMMVAIAYKNLKTLLA